MRRLAPALILWTIASSVAVTGAVASAQEAPRTTASSAPTTTATATEGGGDAGLAGAADLPPGFTDGEPVGGTEAPDPDLPVASPAPAGEAPTARTSAASSTTLRYFGDGPWAAINAATDATSRCSGLTGPELTALVVAPIFKESSAATSPSSAPAPMTLSRYDEWNGTSATTSNQSANGTLYAFRDPYTAYPRAFWHPGIGIWQYDSAGVGAPYTAIERMDTRVVAGDVAAGMAARYCSPPTNVVGHGAPFTDQERRDAAWWPWWAGSSTRSCSLCQAEYAKMTASTPYFANVSLVQGMSATGGAVKRSCTLPGSTAAVECWYVNPSVGVIQGATGWATLAPDGRGTPTVAPTPLSKPFYVIKRNGYEERHWLKADTGYDIDISGKRLLGKNERVRSNQAGSGITWSASSGLCDLTASRGSCATTPVTPPPATNPVPAPAGIKATTASVGGTYRPISFDYDGDGKGDILWYAPGVAGDALWQGRGSGQFGDRKINIGSTYEDVLPLDVNGDGRDDLLFYQRSTGRSFLWYSRGDGTFTSVTLSPGAGRQPLIGDFDGDGGDDVFWYGPGAVADSLWTWNGIGFDAHADTVSGAYQPFVGDFDGNGLDDIFWYGPGPSADRLWLHARAGGYVSKAIAVGGPYTPLVGDFNGDRQDDVFWYAPGTAADYSWFATGAGTFSSTAVTVSDSYEPVVLDLDGDRRDDIVWHKPNGTTDFWTRWTPTRDRSSITLATKAPHQAVPGSFSAGGGDGIFWYAPGATIESIWYR
ncbi:VCBS repeat-containing protein [Aquihabitans sp. G128]|uniref:FG-GAP repeat domain-containing protein n=1 Tax=Aquihabitans sp. G128 TaxID=2849779 RepID=UPI001C241A03|nr:VCBS repeat-containing protein [Aquihabitans sp. G128]QXC62570.1 VCBS repeat-containing protein [Aquihabitans sp. G128]